HRRGDPRELSRSHRRKGRVSRGRRQGGEAVPETGYAGGDQERAAPQGDGAREISAPIGAAGDRAGVEDRVRPRRREELAQVPAKEGTTAHELGALPHPLAGEGWGGGRKNKTHDG